MTPSKTRFTLLHGSRSAGDLPPQVILSPLASIAQNDPSRLRLKLFVDDKAPSSDLPYDLNVGRIDKQVVEDVLEIRRPSVWDKLLRRRFDSKGIIEEDRKVLLLVCGPDPYVLLSQARLLADGGLFRMISAIAGPWGRNYSQGFVGGVLGQLGFGSDQVRKL